MKAISTRLLVASITFSLGVVVAAVWMVQRVPQQSIDPVDLQRVVQIQPPAVATACFPGVGVKLTAAVHAKGAYFPQGAFFQDTLLDQSFANAYTRRFKQMNESSLWFLPDEVPYGVYRFVWLRSFHSPVVVRIWIDAGKRMTTVKELSRVIESGSSPLQVERTRSLTPDEWQTFSRLVDTSCFWDMKSTFDDPIAEDGAWWVLEGAWDGHYHITHRQSPSDQSYRELCLYMLKLSGLPLNDSEIY